MADLVRVELVDGTKTTVGRDWLTRWPEDIKRVLDPVDPAPVREEPQAVESVTTAPTGEKEKK